MSHIHDSDTAYDGWCASCPEPAWTLRARVSQAITNLGYWLRPYDQLLDARRWRWQKSGHEQNRMYLDANPQVLARLRAIQRDIENGSADV